MRSSVVSTIVVATAMVIAPALVFACALITLVIAPPGSAGVTETRTGNVRPGFSRVTVL